MPEALDDVVRDLLRQPSAPVRLVILPVLVVVVYIAARWLIRVLVPWLCRAVVARVLVLSVSSVVLGVLAVDLVLASLFRMADAIPPSPVYRIGDAAVMSSRALLSSVDRFTARARAFGRLPQPVLLAMFGVAVWWLNSRTCALVDVAGCRPPLDVWVSGVRQAWSRAF